MATSFYPLNGEQKNVLHKAVEHAPVAPNFARTGDANPNLRVLVINFDGTGNDRDRKEPGLQSTLISHCYETYRDCENPAIISQYHKGVGTSSGRVRRLLDSAFGTGCEENSLLAYEQALSQVSAWRKENPDLDLHVHVTGFSRGSATALDFLNLVHERGFVGPDEEAPDAPLCLQPAKVQTSACLLDTVSTGQVGNLRLTVPTSCVALLHITAANEQRQFFSLQEISNAANQEISFAINAHLDGAPTTPDGMVCYQRIQQVEIPGAHSDVGGAYVGGGVREVSQYLMERFQASLGLDVEPKLPTAQHIQNCRLHDSLRDWTMESALVGHGDGDVFDLLKERKVDPIQKDNWDGMISQRSVVILPDGSSSADIDLQQIDLSSNLRDWMGTPLEITIKPSSKLKSISLECEPLTVCEWRKDGLYVLDRKIHGLPSQKDMLVNWKKQMDAGLPVQPYKVSFEIHRMGAMVQTNQFADAPAAPPLEPFRDPWPSAIRDQVIRLNTTTQLDAKDANESFHRSCEAVAKAIQAEFDGISSVTITPRKIMETTTSGRRVVNTFVVSAEREDGKAFNSDVPPSGRLEVELYARMRALKAGLCEVTEGLRRAGFQPAEKSVQKFETGAVSCYDGNELLCGLEKPGQKPIHVPKNFMQMMGAFTSSAAGSDHFRSTKNKKASL